MSLKKYIDKRNIVSTVIGGLILTALLYLISWIGGHYASVGKVVSPWFNSQVCVNPWWLPLAYIATNILISIPIILSSWEFRFATRSNRPKSITGKAFPLDQTSWLATPNPSDHDQVAKLPFAFGSNLFRSLSCKVTFDNDETRFFRFGVKFMAKREDYQLLKVGLAHGKSVRLAVIKNSTSGFRVEMHIGKTLFASYDGPIVPSSQTSQYGFSFDFKVASADGQHLSAWINDELILSKPLPMASLEHAILIAWGEKGPFKISVDNLAIQQMVTHPLLVKN